MRTTGSGWVIGVLAALVGAASGHAVAGLVNPASSPVVAVGSAVIDLTPTPVKEWAVATFGTADKVVLIVGVLAVVAGLGALAGRLIERRRRLALSLVVALGLVSAAAALTRPDAGVLDAVPAVIAAALGSWVLAIVPGWVDADEPDPADLIRRAHPQARRRLLLGGMGLAGAAGFLALLGERTLPGLERPSTFEPPVLPPPADPLGPLPPDSPAPLPRSPRSGRRPPTSTGST